MSTEQDRFNHSRRLAKDVNAVNKQLKIARSHGVSDRHPSVAEPHRLAKHHVMDCGNPECYLCGNPRKTHKDKLTPQEKRLFQDMENITNRHSNGSTNQESES